MDLLRLKNIKGFIDTGDIKIRPITILIGENSSGKSSILRFPQVIKQTILDESKAPILFYGSSTDYGNYIDVIYEHRLDIPVAFKIGLNRERFIRYLDDSRYRRIIADRIQTDLLSLEVTVSEKNRNIEVDNLQVNDGTKPIFTFIRLDRNSWVFKIDGYGSTRIQTDFNKFLPETRMLSNSKLHGSKIFPYSISEQEQELFVYFFTELRNYLTDISQKINYIGAYRRPPQRYYRFIENGIMHVGSEGQFAPVMLGLDYKIDGILLSRVSQWLYNKFKWKIEIEELKGNLFSIMIVNENGRIRNSLIDAGYGISQIIPIVVQVLSTRYDRKNTVRMNFVSRLNIIEQPEVHLHPYAQTCLVDLFMEGISDGLTTYLIETHSEPMLACLQDYVNYGYINSENVALYQVEKDSENGIATVREIEL